MNFFQIYSILSLAKLVIWVPIGHRVQDGPETPEIGPKASKTPE